MGMVPGELMNSESMEEPGLPTFEPTQSPVVQEPRSVLEEKLDLLLLEEANGITDDSLEQEIMDMIQRDPKWKEVEDPQEKADIEVQNEIILDGIERQNGQVDPELEEDIENKLQQNKNWREVGRVPPRVGKEEPKGLVP